MKIWLLGLSIYPVSYIVSIIVKLLGGGWGAGGYILDPPASYPLWLIIIFFDSMLHRFFGVNLTQLSPMVEIIIWLLIIVILITLTAICFKLVISIIPQNWKLIAIIIVYALLVAINSYIPEVNL